jgi:Fur family transcriptional regulator, peroxide stress response regulator
MPTADESEALDIRPILTAKGIPHTRQRRDVWRYFTESEHAHTITETAEALAPGGIGQATVYRAIALFSELGLLHRVQTLSGDVCYTAIHPGHRHPLVCGSCRRVVDFAGDDDVKDLHRRLARETGFAIYGHHIEVYGICPECQAKGVSADALGDVHNGARCC